jgi:hypothetical protein
MPDPTCHLPAARINQVSRESSSTSLPVKAFNVHRRDESGSGGVGDMEGRRAIDTGTRAYYELFVLETEEATASDKLQ